MENIPTSSAHIPGPWHVTTCKAPAVYGGEKHFAIIDDPDTGYGIIIADLETMPEAEANARLMAAAPELLAALETVNEWSIDTRGDDFPYWIVERAIDKARGIKSSPVNHENP